MPLFGSSLIFWIEECQYDMMLAKIELKRQSSRGKKWDTFIHTLSTHSDIHTFIKKKKVKPEQQQLNLD
jgi:hypothetical protein